jgi:hypothetical protein
MLRFRAEDFTAKLPWFYHGADLHPPQETSVLSFEVNGVDLPARTYALTLRLSDERETLAISRDGLHFVEAPARGQLIPLAPVDVSKRRVALYIRADSPDAPNPVTEVYLHPLDTKLVDVSDAPLFTEYVRDIGRDDSEALNRWDEFWPMLADCDVHVGILRGMRSALVDWAERRQVRDEDDPHFGAIYSEEDKYDFRDAAAAAVAFARSWQETGDSDWRQRALDARTYVYEGQHECAERRGGWAHMVSGEWGGDHQTNYTRITDPLPPVDGVDTAIIINLLCSTIDAGLEPDEEDVERIRRGAEWIRRSELRPGVFAHHEGATHDCQNSNALAAMALSRAYNTLRALEADAPPSWPEAAHRGFEHYLEGQEAIGVWPYKFGEVGRGQRFGHQNVPDHGMGVYHFLVAADELGLTQRHDVQHALRRAARWYLCTCRIDEDEPGPTIDLEYQRDGGGLLFSSFTWCRFMAAAALLRISRVTDEEEPWRALSLRLMEHVRAKLWNEEDPDSAPVVASCREDITLQSWIAAAEWEAVLLGEMLDGLGRAGG